VGKVVIDNSADSLACYWLSIYCDRCELAIQQWVIFLDYKFREQFKKNECEACMNVQIRVNIVNRIFLILRKTKHQ